MNDFKKTTQFKLSLLLVLFAFNSMANIPLIDSAKTNYDLGKFDIAISQYESVLTQQQYSEELYYNLGNAYYRIGKIGLSILNFEKALKINPHHENAAFNLQLANTKIQDKFESIPQFSIKNILRGVNNNISHNVLSILGTILIIGAASLYLLAKSRKNKKQMIFVRVLSLAGVILVLLSWQQKSAVENYTAGIVIKNHTNVFSEPNPNSTLLFEINQGSKLEILSNSNNWINVKAPNNEIGWIEHSALSEINP